MPLEPLKTTQQSPQPIVSTSPKEEKKFLVMVDPTKKPPLAKDPQTGVQKLPIHGVLYSRNGIQFSTSKPNHFLTIAEIEEKLCIKGEKYKTENGEWVSRTFSTDPVQAMLDPNLVIQDEKGKLFSDIEELKKCVL